MKLMINKQQETFSVTSAPKPKDANQLAGDKFILNHDPLIIRILYAKFFFLLNLKLKIVKFDLRKL